LIRLSVVMLNIIFLVSCAIPSPSSMDSDSDEIVKYNVDYTYCQTPRPRMCTREFRPVCAVQKEAGKTFMKTYPTGCVACSNQNVSAYIKEPCKNNNK
jgi:hypothetical protein